MALQEREKKLIPFGVGALILTLSIVFWPSGEDAPKVVSMSDSPEVAEKRLAKTLQLVALAPAKEEEFARASADLRKREKGMIQADTAAQAQAQLFQILRRIGRGQPSPIDVRAAEIGQAKSFGNDYGEVSVAVVFECRVEQLVNMLADLAAQPELLATSDIRISAGASKEKVMQVRLSVSGIVPKKLIPEKKGFAF
jgi:Type II secretion system (T2SS), protein M subtype b